MSALTPDYDSNPQRWRSWSAPQDVHDMIAGELRGRVLDALPRLTDPRLAPYAE